MKVLISIYSLIFSYSCLAQPVSEDKLKTTPLGHMIQPLSQQQLPEDGSSGLAYQKKTYNKSEASSDKEQTTTRRLKAVEREYSFSGSTFDDGLRNQINVPAKASFQTQTMGEAARAVKRENIRFEECKNGDKNCAEYEVDKAGKVIW